MSSSWARFLQAAQWRASAEVEGVSGLEFSGWGLPLFPKKFLELRS